jgi:hypothetical protein
MLWITQDRPDVSSQATDAAFEMRLHLLRGWAARLPEMGLCPPRLPRESDSGTRRTPWPRVRTDLRVEADG